MKSFVQKFSRARLKQFIDCVRLIWERKTLTKCTTQRRLAKNKYEICYHLFSGNNFSNARHSTISKGFYKREKPTYRPLFHVSHKIYLQFLSSWTRRLVGIPLHVMQFLFLENLVFPIRFMVSFYAKNDDNDKDDDDDNAVISILPSISLSILWSFISNILSLVTTRSILNLIYIVSKQFSRVYFSSL